MKHSVCTGCYISNQKGSLRFLWIAILLVISCLFLSERAFSQNIQLRLDSLFTTLDSNRQYNGNVLVTVNEREYYSRSFGYADVEKRLKNNSGSKFHLASVSKTFTVLAILQLKQRRKLDLDDYFEKYFPDFPFHGITIRHLLSHTSGLPDYQIFEEPYHKNPAKLYTNNDLMQALREYKKGLLFQPGDKFSYSNTGYGLLALLVEKLSGMRLQDYLSKYIFQPAGMVNTYFESPQLQVNDSCRARRYEYLTYDPEKLKIIDSVKADYIDAFVLGGLIGPTGIVSTAGDLLKFDQALYGNKLIKQTILLEAFKPTTLNNGKKAVMGWQNTLSYYGLGWQILCDSTYGTVVWHGGGAAGIVTVFLRNITKKQTVIALNNVTHRGVHVQGLNAFYILNNGPLFIEKKSLASLYVTTLHKKGTHAAATILNQYKTDSLHYYLDERALNKFGYDLLGDGYHTEALEVFKLNSILFPQSFNVYDSYADALNRMGMNEEAIRMYRKSIELNPRNEGGMKALNVLLKKGD